MRYLAFLSILLLSGCMLLEAPKPIITIHGQKDFLYVRIGLMWGQNLSEYIQNNLQDQILRGDEDSDWGSESSKSKGSGSSGCSGGSCKP